ncbi:hypothetical protein FJY84_07580, partial [Candidatus Bathyarchaeota archaeon]|nr:hypothetical protein [Candidatus Bathyarchaeota archaeon]
MKYIKYVMLSLIFLFCINIHLLAAINNDSIFVKQIGNPERDIILMPYSRIVKNYPVESNIALELKEKKFNYNKITDYEVESSSPNAIPDRFITLEEFSSRGETEYWFTILGLSELNKETIDSREIHYSMKPLGFSMSNSNMESIATVYENGVNPIVVSRDPKTEFLSIPNYKSIFIDKVNDMIKEISLEPKSTSWKQNILLSNDLQNIIEVTPWSIPVYFEVDDLFAGNQRYLLIKYSSTPFLYQPEYINQKIQQQFTGFAILSYDKEKTYYSMYRYSGSIYYPASVYKDTLESCTFKGQNITFMANLDTGEAILPPDSIKGFEEMLSSYQLINYSKLSSEYSDTITPPDWLPFVWGVSRENLICASVAAEQRTNLLPIVVALLGAHIVDSWWTYSVNTGDYLADVVKGRQGAKWDPFNSKNSFLTRYFYEPA